MHRRHTSRHADGNARRQRPCTLRSAVVGAVLSLLLSIAASAQPVEWVQVSTVGHPSARWLHAMAYDSARGVTVLMGGVSPMGGGTLSDTWEYDGASWRPRPVSGPTFRGDHAMAYDSQRGVCVLYGGYPDTLTWEWNGTSWSARSGGTTPSQRWGCGMAYDSARGVTVLFGGLGENGGLLSDTWEWNGTRWTQRQASGGPPGLYHPRMAFDSARGRTVLYGGSRDGGPNFVSSDTWEWDGAAWTFRTAAGPHGRYRHALAYDSARGVCVMYGGTAVEGSLGRETWEWNGVSWVQRSGDVDRYGNALAYDSARHVTVLFGNVSNNTNTMEWTVPCSAQVNTVSHPRSAIACPGAGAPFAVVASGPFPIEYSWQISVAPNEWATLTDSPLTLPCGGTALASSPNSDATSIIVNPCAGKRQYLVRAMMSTSTCQAPSNAATLTHPPSADANQDGQVTSQDFFDYVCQWLGDCPATSFTDFNQNGVVNSQDFFDFLAAFFAGC